MTVRSPIGMVDVFVERRVRGPMEDHLLTRQSRICLDLYNALCKGSWMAADRRHLLCHFHAPDIDSVRMALHSAGVEYDALWVGNIEDGEHYDDYAF